MSTQLKDNSYEADRLIAQDIEAYLERHQHKSLLRFITCGSVDDGKSTLIGRLLYESKTIFEDQCGVGPRRLSYVSCPFDAPSAPSVASVPSVIPDPCARRLLPAAAPSVAHEPIRRRRSPMMNAARR